jgi:predicted HTH domain antitoxin
MTQRIVAHYAGLYRDGKRTLARAARDAGVSVWEMIDYVRQHKITAQYDLEDPDHDFAAIQSRRRR